MNQNNRGDKIALITVSIIVISVIALLLWKIFESDLGFYNNGNTNETNNENQIYHENNQNREPSQNEIDNMNVDPPKPTVPIEEQIAFFQTAIYDKEQGRIHNIGLAISKLNNKTINVGEEFSFNDTIGPMGKEQGYEKALGFDTNGKKIQVYGGGMCQLSSTLYNAALIANLQITERHPHSRRVYYVPKDKDATIYYPDLDLKFINNTDSKIRINASNTDADVKITLTKIKE